MMEIVMRVVKMETMSIIKEVHMWQKAIRGKSVVQIEKEMKF